MKTPRILVACLAAVLLSSCASSRPVKRQAYADLPGSKTFEYSFPAVWTGIEEAVRGYKVVDREPEEVSAVEMKKLTERELKTDWIYSRSRDQYVEYEVNGYKRRQELQTRVRYTVKAEQVMGGVKVRIETQQETEKLGKKGESLGYSGTEPSSSLAHELLTRVEQAILAAGPTSDLP